MKCSTQGNYKIWNKKYKQSPKLKQESWKEHLQFWVRKKFDSFTTFLERQMWIGVGILMKCSSRPSSGGWESSHQQRKFRKCLESQTRIRVGELIFQNSSLSWFQNPPKTTSRMLLQKPFAFLTGMEMGSSTRMS